MIEVGSKVTINSSYMKTNGYPEGMKESDIGTVMIDDGESFLVKCETWKGHGVGANNWWIPKSYCMEYIDIETKKEQTHPIKEDKLEFILDFLSQGYCPKSISFCKECPLKKMDSTKECGGRKDKEVIKKWLFDK